MKELSIFVDESGDFGRPEPHSPHYLVGMVFHDQSNGIKADVSRINSRIAALGLSPDFYIHVGPAIRKERDFYNMPVALRRKLIYILSAFFRHAPVACIAFRVEKRHAADSDKVARRLEAQIQDFVSANLAFLQEYSTIKIYYDNGQPRITKILRRTIGETLTGVVIKDAPPDKYRLAQVADLVCTLSLLEIKMQKKSLSKSEQHFFRNTKELQKAFLSLLEKKKFGAK